MGAKENIIGNFIREKRTKKGISQGDLGKRLGYGSAQFISNLERGLAPLPPKIMKDLTKYLDISEREMLSIMLKEHEVYLTKVLRGKHA